MVYIHDFFAKKKQTNKQTNQKPTTTKRKENERKTRLNPAISWPTIDKAWLAKD